MAFVFCGVMNCYVFEEKGIWRVVSCGGCVIWCESIMDVFVWFNKGMKGSIWMTIVCGNKREVLFCRDEYRHLYPLWEGL